MYYQRNIKDTVARLSRGFPVISVTGPRQSGKTTFLLHHFVGYEYFNLEDPQIRQLIEADPKHFLEIHSKNIIIDEVQRIPDFLSYIQAHVDTHQTMGSIIISGSQNLLISERISQSLAGRAAYQNILPFSCRELKESSLLQGNRYQQILKGFYPALYTREISPFDYYKQYLSTYIERDVRLIKNVQDLSQSQKFMQLLAGRVGQVLNISSLANDVGISPNTALQWVSILEASYIAYRLPPYFGNAGKRLIKSPKIYFYDTGVLCALLNISSENELTTHYNIGSIFENMIISEFMKELAETGASAKLYFYRDNHGNEMDLVVDTGTELLPIEIKSSSTFTKNFFSNFNYWQRNVKKDASGYVVYGGTTTQDIKEHKLVSWKNLEVIFSEIR